MNSPHPRILAIIPARGGSKGLPGKNIKPLCGKPLIHYAIDTARGIVDQGDICVSTDDPEIAACVTGYGLNVPFLRPAELASDTATTSDVLVHAYRYFREWQGKEYDAILLLQTTSPLRTVKQVREAIALYRPDIDMVVSVKESHAAVVLCREEEDGYLTSALNKNNGPRQQMSPYYEYNGAIYVINPLSLLEKGMANFTKRVKYVMPVENSIDIDTPLDFELAAYFLPKLRPG